MDEKEEDVSYVSIKSSGRYIIVLRILNDSIHNVCGLESSSYNPCLSRPAEFYEYYSSREFQLVYSLQL
jgi:hypothetical protein